MHLYYGKHRYAHVRTRVLVTESGQLIFNPKYVERQVGLDAARNPFTQA